MTGFERAPSVAAYLPSEVARLVLGYLKDEGCSKTYHVFLDECSHLKEYAVLLKGGLSYPLHVDGKSLVSMLNEYRSLRLEDLQPRDAGTLSTLWRKFDIVVNQLKLIHGLGSASTRGQKVLGASSQRAYHKQLGGNIDGGGSRCALMTDKDGQPSVNGNGSDSFSSICAIPAQPTVAVPTVCAAAVASRSPAVRGVAPCRTSSAVAITSSTYSPMMLPFVPVSGLLAAVPVPIAPRPPLLLLPAPTSAPCQAQPVGVSTSAEVGAAVCADRDTCASSQLPLYAAPPLATTVITASSSAISSATPQCSSTGHPDSMADSDVPTLLPVQLQAACAEDSVQEVTQETDAGLVVGHMCEETSSETVACSTGASAASAPSTDSIFQLASTVTGSPRRKRSSAERKKRMTPGKNLRSPGKAEVIENLADLFPMPSLVETLLGATEWQEHLAENINRHLTRRSAEKGPDELQGTAEMAEAVTSAPADEPVVRFEESETEAAIREVLAITRSDPTFGDFHALMDCAYVQWNVGGHESSLNGHYDSTVCYSDVETIRMGPDDAGEAVCVTELELQQSQQQEQQQLHLQEQLQLELQSQQLLLSREQQLPLHGTSHGYDRLHCAATASECRPTETVAAATPAPHWTPVDCSKPTGVEATDSTVPATVSTVERASSLPTADHLAETGPAAIGVCVAAAVTATTAPRATAPLTVYPVRSSARLRMAGVLTSVSAQAGLPPTSAALPVAPLADGVTAASKVSLPSSAASSIGESASTADGFVNLAPHTTDSGTTMYLVISNGNNVDKRIVSRGSTSARRHEASKRPSAHAVRRIRPLCPASVPALGTGPLSAADHASLLATAAEQAPAECAEVPPVASIARQRNRKKVPKEKQSVPSDSLIIDANMEKPSRPSTAHARKAAGLRKNGRHVRVLTFSPSRQSVTPAVVGKSDSSDAARCSYSSGRTRAASSRNAAGRAHLGNEPCSADDAMVSLGHATRTGRHAKPDASMTADTGEVTVPELVGQLVHVVEQRDERQPLDDPVSAGRDFVVLSCDGAEIGRVGGISASDEEELFRQFTIVDDQRVLEANSATSVAAADDHEHAVASTAPSPATCKPAPIVAVNHASVQQKRPPDESVGVLHGRAATGTSSPVSNARCAYSNKKPRLKDIDIEKFLSKIHK